MEEAGNICKSHISSDQGAEKFDRRSHVGNGLTCTDMMKKSVQLISECQKTNHANQQSPLFSPNKNMNSSTFNQNSTFRNVTSRLPAYVFDPTQPNPQEKEEIEKYFDKLKVKGKRNGKVPTIRKSELGENQKVFTTVEQMKLEVIDEFLERGFDLPTDLYNIELRPEAKVPAAIEPIIEFQNKENWYGEQLRVIENWGFEGNKGTVIENLEYKHRGYLRNIEVENHPHKKSHKKQPKSLNFQLRKISGSRELRRKNSCKVDRKNLRRSTRNQGMVDRMRAIGAIIISQFETEKYMEYATAKKFPPLPRSINSRMSENILKCMSRKEQLAKLRRYLIQKYIKLPTSEYMTIDRKQALFQCEMIKGAKQIMSMKDYLQLEFIRESEDGEANAEDDKEYFFSDKPGEEHENQQKICNKQEEVEKQLQKNRLRLKMERQRVIEKLRC